MMQELNSLGQGLMRSWVGTGEERVRKSGCCVGVNVTFIVGMSSIW